MTWVDTLLHTLNDLSGFVFAIGKEFCILSGGFGTLIHLP